MIGLHVAGSVLIRNGTAHRGFWLHDEKKEKDIILNYLSLYYWSNRICSRRVEKIWWSLVASEAHFLYFCIYNF